MNFIEFNFKDKIFTSILFLIFMLLMRIIFYFGVPNRLDLPHNTLPEIYSINNYYFSLLINLFNFMIRLGILMAISIFIFRVIDRVVVYNKSKIKNYQKKKKLD